MGQQQVKERTSSTSSGTLGLGAGSSLRHSKTKPRVPKDGRILGSNIFTEHNGEYTVYVRLKYIHAQNCQVSLKI